MAENGGSWEDATDPNPVGPVTTAPKAPPKQHIPQKSWADDDDDFEPARPTELRPVTYPATSSTSTSASQSQAAGSAGARGDFSSFAPKDRREGREGYRGGRGGGEGYRGRGYEGGAGGYRDRVEGGELQYNTRGDFRDSRDAAPRDRRGRGSRRGQGERGGGRRRELADFIDTEYQLEQVTEWDKFEFKEEVLRGIFAKGFEKPSLCQSQGIKPLLDGKNLLLQAQSGHGKTAVFGTAIVERIDTAVGPREAIQALVLVPNRDLARQVTEEIRALGQYLDPPLKIVCCVGSAKVQTEEARDERVAMVKELRADPPHVLVGTIGRVCDLSEGRMSSSNPESKGAPVIWLRNTKFLVLDEADEMLFDSRNPEQGEGYGGRQGGHTNSNYLALQSLTHKIAPTTQIVLTSATFSTDEVHAFNPIKSAQEIFPHHSFVNITLEDHQLNRSNIQQFYIVVHRHDERVWLPELIQLKLQFLEQLVSIFANGQIYVFCTNKDQVEMVMRNNSYEGSRYTTDVEDFKAGRKTVLVCTNALARGLDVQAASVVMNFELCDPQRYMQRIGRVGRFGRAGTAISLIPPYQVDKSAGRSFSIEHITELYKNKIAKWDFDVDKLEPWVRDLPGFGIDASLTDEAPAAPAGKTQPPEAPSQRR